MKRWIALAAAIYPRNWREQYGREFDALLDDVRPGWRVFANVLGGAITMQITTGTNWIKLVGATAAFGAIVAGAMSFTVAPHYVSSAVIRLTPQPDPLRPTPPEALRQRAATHFAEMEGRVLSRASLGQIINNPLLDIYKREREQMPLDDVVDLMRRNVRIQARSSTNDGIAPFVFSVSFSYPDHMKAQAIARALAARLTQENVTANRNQTGAYREFWKDMLAAHLAKPAPPPPPEDVVTILVPASLPKESEGPNRVVFLAWGLGAGLLLGLLAVFALRSPRGAMQLAGFAAAGCVLAAAASFLIANRYTSTAIMEIAPAQLTEDPLAPLPPPTPAAEFLRQLEPAVLSDENLARIIQEPRVNLYPEERARRPIEDVVRSMVAHDLRVAVVNPASVPNAAPSAFSISFSYSDPRKTQDMENALISAFIRESTVMGRARAGSVTQQEMVSRRAGEYLDTLDRPSFPYFQQTPNRRMFAVAGLGTGLLAGAIVLFLRRTRTPALRLA